jgi:hypothetical protein
MAEFIFTKEKFIVPREKIEMILQKHTINEVPPTDKELLMIIDIGRMDYNLWTVGTWDENGWCCPFDEVGYTVVEWYELPPQKRIVEDYSYHQMRMEEFWNDK